MQHIEKFLPSLFEETDWERNLLKQKTEKECIEDEEVDFAELRKMITEIPRLTNFAETRLKKYQLTLVELDPDCHYSKSKTTKQSTERICGQRVKRR